MHRYLQQHRAIIRLRRDVLAALDPNAAPLVRTLFVSIRILARDERFHPTKPLSVRQRGMDATFVSPLAILLAALGVSAKQVSLRLTAAARRAVDLSRCVARLRVCELHVDRCKFRRLTGTA